MSAPKCLTHCWPQKRTLQSSLAGFTRISCPINLELPTASWQQRYAMITLTVWFYQALVRSCLSWNSACLGLPSFRFLPPPPPHRPFSPHFTFSLNLFVSLFLSFFLRLSLTISVSVCLGVCLCLVSPCVYVSACLSAVCVYVCLSYSVGLLLFVCILYNYGTQFQACLCRMMFEKCIKSFINVCVPLQ